MATETQKKHAWLIDVLSRHKKITFKQIKELWSQSAVNRDGRPLARRTFFKWIEDVRSVYGYKISCDAADGYAYSIEMVDEEDGFGTARWMLNAISVGNLIEENAAIKDRILLEEIPCGAELLPVICEAIRNGNKLRMVYRSFQKDHDSEFDVEPYYLKMYHRRWYLVGKSDKFRTYALDRMKSAKVLTGVKFELPENFNAKEFTSKFYGIYRPDCDAERIELLVSSERADYLRSLPMHGSQKEEYACEDFSVFSFYMPPTNEFIGDVLSMGSAAEVIAPDDLRLMVADELDVMEGNYDGLI